MCLKTAQFCGPVESCCNGPCLSNRFWHYRRFLLWLGEGGGEGRRVEGGPVTAPGRRTEGGGVGGWGALVQHTTLQRPNGKRGGRIWEEGTDDDYDDDKDEGDDVDYDGEDYGEPLLCWDSVIRFSLKREIITKTWTLIAFAKAMLNPNPPLTDRCKIITTYCIWWF